MPYKYQILFENARTGQRCLIPYEKVPKDAEEHPWDMFLRMEECFYDIAFLSLCLKGDPEEKDVVRIVEISGTGPISA